MPLFVLEDLKLSKWGPIMNISSKGEKRHGTIVDKIGELISMEIDEVKDVEYLDEEMGYMFYINLKDGRKILLSLIDSKM